MTPEISIILPAIRPNKWIRLYNSILQSTRREFELIIVSPYPLPEGLLAVRNVKYVKDFGSPMRASNIGALLCEGELVTWAADDAVFLEGSLDNNIDILYSMEPKSIKNVVVSKYFEGEGEEKPLQPDSYFKINGAPPTSSPHVDENWWIFNVAILYRSFFEELGGWDCSFQACPMGHTDMAVRAQSEGAIVKMTEFPLLDCGHMPGTTGDHAPIHHAQLGDDEPLFQQRYRDPSWKEKVLNHININNWKKSDSVWNKRFTI